MATDWKDALASLMPASPDNDSDAADALPVETERKGPEALPHLNIAYERKGRNGKSVTIIYGFDPENEKLLQETSSFLKKTIGIGGSARGGEILLQGDWREKSAELLRKKGFRVGSAKK